MKIPFTLGRLLFGGFFVVAGINHFLQYKTLTQFARSKQLPLAPVAVLGTGAMLTAGGASVLLGLHPKWGAAAIMLFLAGATPVMHDFWNDESPEARQNNQINFMKNTALLGAALVLAAVEEPWPLSLALPHREERPHPSGIAA
jgi:putative oxidoreductase